MDGHDDPNEHTAVGLEVRRRRHQRSWTLDEAAARLGVSRRLLVQIEAGQANPSLSTLLLVATGFDVSLVELLSGADKPSVSVQAHDVAPVLWVGTNGGQARLLAGSDSLEMWEWTLGPGDERASDAHRPGSREAMTVVEGSVVVTVGDAEPVRVASGYSASFRADEPHGYRNDGEAAAVFWLAVHEPAGARS